MNCPSCSSDAVRRSHAHGPERLFRILLARKMYLCWHCGRRFGVMAFDPRADTATSIVWSGIVLSMTFLLLFLLFWLF